MLKSPSNQPELFCKTSRKQCRYIYYTYELIKLNRGVPAVVDLAAMRDAIKRLGGDPLKINPLCPVDLVIDHSVQVDIARTKDAKDRNEALEFDRNRERFQFLKWGSHAFNNFKIVPPGSGIVH